MLDIDRGYLASPAVETLFRDGATLHSRPWVMPNRGFFTKDQFRIDIRRQVVTCPRGATAAILPQGEAIFDSADCGGCPLKRKCTRGQRRSVQIHRAEALLIELRKKKRTKAGRPEA